MSNSLDDFLAGPILKNDPFIRSVLTGINDRPDCLLLITEISARIVKYVNPSCEMRFGYSAAQFLECGPELLYQLTDDPDKPEVIRRQIAHTQRAKSHGFDPRELIVEECTARMITKDGRKIHYVCLIVVLTYTSSADMQYVLSVFMQQDSGSREDVKRLLLHLKSRHNQVYQHPPFQLNGSPLHLVHITSTRHDLKVTKREVEVIQLLSQGFGSKEIALTLGVSYNTVETHRKHLLEKFEARNVAELIKKASKVFWLE